MKEPKIRGGRAYFNGISIYSNIGFATVNYKSLKKEFFIRKGSYIKNTSKMGKILNFLFKIPFIRSFSIFYNIIKNNKKMILKIVGVYILLIMFLENMSDEVISGIDSFLSNEMRMYLIIMLVVGLIIKITPISNYHGAEHMVINYYNKYKDLEFRNLSEVSRVSNSCGSVLILITFIIFYFMTFIFKNSDLNFLISYMIAYEIFLSKSNYFKPIFLLSSFIQKYILTSRPNKIQLQVAKIALEKSISNINR